MPIVESSLKRQNDALGEDVKTFLDPVTNDHIQAMALVDAEGDQIGITARPMQVADAGGSLTVDQTTHDSLNANANLQVGDADVANGNPVPVSDAGGSITVDGTVTIQEPLSIDDNGGSLTVDDGDGSLTVDGAVTIQEPLSVDDNGGSLTVDDGGSSLTVDNTTLSVVGGGVEASALRVTIANNSTGLLSIDDGGGSLTIDGTVDVTEINQDDLDTAGGIDNQALVGIGLAESGGHALVGSANPMPIGDAGGSLTVDNTVLSVVGGGAEATAQRVTIANDSTGVLTIDDGGGSITIDASSLPLPTGAANAANQQAAATTPAIYNVTMTNADTEYSQALPAGIKRFSLQCQGNYNVRFAFVAGKVATPTAPYGTVKAGMNYYEGNLSLTSVTLYVACGDNSQVAEIIAWS